MNENKINIEIESEKCNFVISGGEVDDLKLVFPLGTSISSQFQKDENGVYNLKISDEITCYSLDKEKVKYGFSLNPILKKIIIIVPNNWITNLTVCLDHGNLLLKDMILNKTDINNAWGKVTIKDSYSEVTFIDGIKTDIKLEGVIGINASLYTCIGNFNLSYNEFDKLNCVTEIGNINVDFMKQHLRNASVNIKDKRIVKKEFKGKQLEKKLSFTSHFGKFNSNVF